MNDPTITSRFRVVVFDMPWHGKSSPPEGWEHDEYRLTTDAYVELIVTVARALGLERPVAMGCSIGGRVVLELARRHPEMFRAVIGLQSSAFMQRYFDLAYLHKPDRRRDHDAGALLVRRRLGRRLGRLLRTDWGGDREG